MKHLIWLLFGILCNVSGTFAIDLNLTSEEKVEILSTDTLYVFCGRSLPLLHDTLFKVYRIMMIHAVPHDHIALLCEHILNKKSIAPNDYVENALEEAWYYLYGLKEFDNEELKNLRLIIEWYYIQFALGTFDITCNKDSDKWLLKRSRIKTKWSVDVQRKLLAGCLGVCSNACIKGNLGVNDDEKVKGTFTILTTPPASSDDFLLAISNAGLVTKTNTFINGDIIINGCQPGPLTIGTSNATDLTFVTQCTDRMNINNEGAVTIQMPEAGEVGLTIVGGGEIIQSGDLEIDAGNIILTSATGGSSTAASRGLIEFGGANPNATNVSSFKVGDRNLFMGNYNTVPNVTGSDNISIGRIANNALSTASNVIGIGNNARALATDSISIGDNINNTIQRTIVIGSRDSTSSGAAPSATALNAIAIGSASGSNGGASASDIAAIALGPADGSTFDGALAAGERSVSIGLNARTMAAADLGIAIGSASGIAGGAAAISTQVNTISIGSGNDAMDGANSTAIGAIAIGGATAVFEGALASGSRSVAIGMGSVSNTNGSIAMGSASTSVGGNGPRATGRTAISLGSAQATLAASSSSNISTIAIGSSDGVFPGAIASGARGTAIGQNATGAGAAICIGSSSGVVGGTAPRASGTTSIAIGSALASIIGPSTTGAGSIVIGSSDGTTPGATASVARAISIGTGASVTTTDRIVLGNAASSAVRVGIGIAAPQAKLDVVGADGVIVLRVNQVTPAIGNAPVWLNPSTSSDAGTPIHRNASNQLFGFTSSKRYKTNIRSIENESNILYQLNPVLYDSNEEYGEGKNIPGFIAEEVYDVAPTLALLNDKNEPENVAYTSLHAFAIKEIQKHKNELDAQNAQIKKQSNMVAMINNLCSMLKMKIDALYMECDDKEENI